MRHINIDKVEIIYPDFLESSKKVSYLFSEKLSAEKKFLESKYVYFWCRGSSGVTFSTSLFNILSDKFPDKIYELSYVKKHGENSHYEQKYRKFYPFLMEYHLIVDDFSVTGNTILEIFKISKKVDCICLSYLTETSFNILKENKVSNILITNFNTIF